MKAPCLSVATIVQPTFVPKTTVPVNKSTDLREKRRPVRFRKGHVPVWIRYTTGPKREKFMTLIAILLVCSSVATPQDVESPWGIAPSHSASWGVGNWSKEIGDTGVHWMRGFHQGEM